MLDRTLRRALLILAIAAGAIAIYVILGWTGILGGTSIPI
jgi:hypothetical protein